ncbi:hypothetical protein ACFE04_013771 [Oxalis oulophora]
MLYRSSSTPVLKSLLQSPVRNPSSPVLKSCKQSPEPETGLPRRPSSVSLKPSSRTSSETDLKKICAISRKCSSSNLSNSLSSLDLKAMDTTGVESPSRKSTAGPIFSLGGGGCVGLMEREEEKVAIGGIGGGDGLFGGGRGGGGGSGGDNGNGNMDSYYQKMITEFPSDSLLLGNYARFLREVGDLVRAEEYCERAILANAREGDVLSMYGDLIWNNHRDASRARYYFHQASQIAPDDCYVLASYAQFLLESGEDDDEEIVRKSKHKCVSSKGLSSTSIAAAY